MIELLYTKTESFVFEIGLADFHASLSTPSHATPPHPKSPSQTHFEKNRKLVYFVLSRLISILGIVFDQQLSKGALSSSRDFPAAYLDE